MDVGVDITENMAVDRVQDDYPRRGYVSAKDVR